MYVTLFNAVTDALEDLEKKKHTSAKRRLMKAQRATEEMFIEAGENLPWENGGSKTTELFAIGAD